MLLIRIDVRILPIILLSQVQRNNKAYARLLASQRDLRIPFFSYLCTLSACPRYRHPHVV